MSEVTSDSFEVFLRNALQKIDTTSYDFKTSPDESNSEFGSCGKRASLTLYFKKECGEVSIEFRKHLIKETLTVVVAYNDKFDEDDDIYTEYKPIKIPRTEEQYFQYYTIQDNVFSLEFFQFLEKVMSELLVKWQSG